MRFFFDYTNKEQSLLDYHGGEFLSVSDAVDFAEATVETLRNSLNADWTGWCVEIRSPEGAKCASLPVTADLEALRMGTPYPTDRVNGTDNDCPSTLPNRHHQAG